MKDEMIYVFKLVSGEEIIAEVDSYTETTIDIKNSFGITATENGSVRIFPWSIVTVKNPNKIITLNKTSIIMYEQPCQEILDMFIKDVNGYKKKLLNE